MNVNINECPVPSDNQPDFPLHRAQMDSIHNLHETLLTDICKDLQLRMLNGRFLGDSLGYFTFNNNNGQSTVDYMISSQNLFYDVEHFMVHSQLEFSDHCMISVYLKCGVQREVTPIVNKTYIGHYIWDNNASDSFRDALLEKEAVDDILHLNSLLDDENYNNIDFLVSKTNTIYLCAASKTLIFKRPMRPNNKRKEAKPRKTWMSNDCLLLRREVRSLGKKLQKDPKNIWIRHTFCRYAKEYNILKKKSKQQFYHSFTDEINSFAPGDSKQFWKSIKQTEKKRHTVFLYN